MTPEDDLSPRSDLPGPSLILASGSPRRRELLERAGVPHEVIPPGVDEIPRPGEPPVDLARRLAREKAEAVAGRLVSDDPRWVLAADTIVILGDRVLGKPRDPAHARQMLGELTGRTHRVVTGVALTRAGATRCWQHASESEVDMREASPAEIEAYVATGEPLDKAGSYGIQGEGGRRFVTAVRGSESNVIGLPVEETLALWKKARHDLASGAAPVTP